MKLISCPSLRGRRGSLDRRLDLSPGSLALWLFLLAGLPSCRSFEKPKFDVNDRYLLLVPFRDLSVPHGHGYGESDRGVKVIEAFRNWAEKNCDPRLSEPAATNAVIRSLREWTREGKPTFKDWKNLLAGLPGHVDLILIGEIQEFRLRDPKSIGFFKGTVKAVYSLINSRTGREEYRSTPVSLEYPAPKGDIEVPMSEFGTKPEEIEKGLIHVLGQQIGKDLFGYYSER